MSKNLTLHEPLVAAVLDRLLVLFWPLMLLFAAAVNTGVCQVSGVSIAALAVALLVALLKRRISAPARVVAYSLCFGATGTAEALSRGFFGDGLLLTFLAVFIASVVRHTAIRRGAIAVELATLGGIAAAQIFGWVDAPGEQGTIVGTSWSGVSGLLLLGFACVAVAHARRLRAGLASKDEQLRLAEGHFRMMFGMAGDATLLIENGRIIESNAQATVSFGYSAQELRELSLVEFSPELQANGGRSAEEGRRLFEAATETPQHFRWMHRRKDGRLFEADVSLSSTLHETRRIHLAIVRDLSDYRMVERENRLLATALNHAGEAVAITDVGGRIV